MNQPVKFSPSARRQSRRVLLQGLYQWELTQSSVEEIQNFLLQEGSLATADRDFFAECLTAIVGKTSHLDALYQPYLDRPFEELSTVERCCIRAGCHELTGRSDIPRNVVLTEWVQLAKLFGAQNSYRFVNAVLDAVARAHRDFVE